MTAPIPPNADELVSAYIDGVAAPDEIAQVESDEMLMARAATMRNVSAVLAVPVTAAPIATKEAHLAAALGQFDTLFASPVPSAQASEPSTVTSLDQERERRRPRRLNIVAAAAAAVAVLFAGIVAFGLNANPSNDVADRAAGDSLDMSETSANVLATEADSATAQSNTDDAADESAEDTATSAVDTADTAGAAPQADARAPTDAEAEFAQAGDTTTGEADRADNDDPIVDGDDAVVASDDEAGDDAVGQGSNDRATPIVRDLGDHLTTAALRDSVLALVEDPDGVDFAALDLPIPLACIDPTRQLGTDSLLAIATVQGEPVEIHRGPYAELVALTISDCSLLATLTP